MAGDPAHDHDHDHGHSDAPTRALSIALILNVLFLIVEVGVGLWANSLALLSDAGHMVSDVAALALALAARRIARMASSHQYTFGLRRVPVLGGLLNAATLIVIVGLIIFEAIRRIEAPVDVTPTPVLVAGVIGLAINLGSAWYLSRAGGSDVNIRGAMLHMLADAAGSVVAIVSAVVIATTGWLLIDPILSLVIAVLIAVGSWPLLRDTVNIILQRAPDALDVQEIRQMVLDDDMIDEIDDLHIWQLVDDFYVASAIVRTRRDVPLSEVDERRARLKTELAERFHVEHATIEWRFGEPDGDGCE